MCICISCEGHCLHYVLRSLLTMLQHAWEPLCCSSYGVLLLTYIPMLVLPVVDSVRFQMVPRWHPETLFGTANVALSAQQHVHCLHCV
jgi:hypothetical protein